MDKDLLQLNRDEPQRLESSTLAKEIKLLGFQLDVLYVGLNVLVDRCGTM